MPVVAVTSGEVLKAGQADTEGTAPREALETHCKKYWMQEIKLEGHRTELLMIHDQKQELVERTDREVLEQFAASHNITFPFPAQQQPPAPDEDEGEAMPPPPPQQQRADSGESTTTRTIDGSRTVQAGDLWSMQVETPEDRQRMEEANEQYETFHDAAQELEGMVVISEGADEDNEDEEPESQLSDVTASPALRRRRQVHFHPPITVMSNGQPVVVKGVPKTHIVVHCSVFGKLRDSNYIVQEIKKSLRTLQFSATRAAYPLARDFLATALASAPGLSQQAAAIMIPLIVMWFITWASPTFAKTVTADEITNVCPTRTTLRNVMSDAATDALMESGAEMKKAGHYAISSDKGEKKHVDHFAKVISWFSWPLKKVMTMVLDIDATGHCTASAGLAIRRSVDRMAGFLSKFRAQATDSGGGGILEDLGQSLESHGLCALNPYFVLNCTLHSFQLCLSIPMKLCFGEGDLGTKNLTQMLFNAYYLCNLFQIDEWKGIVKRTFSFLKQTKGYTKVSDLQGNDHWEPVPDAEKWDVNIERKIPKPVLTRWWLVGEVAVLVFNIWKLLIAVSGFIVRQTKASLLRNKAASDLWAMINPLNPDSQILYLHLTFVVAFHQGFWNSHFEFLQALDVVSKLPSFSARNVLVRYYLAWSQLTKMCDIENLRQQPHFQCFYREYDRLRGLASSEDAASAAMTASIDYPLEDLTKETAGDPNDGEGDDAEENEETVQPSEEETAAAAAAAASATEATAEPMSLSEHLDKMDSIVKKFIRSSLDSLNKHFKRWANSLLILGLASEAPTARTVATYMLSLLFENEEHEFDRNIFESPIHGRSIDLGGFADFLQEFGASAEEVRKQVTDLGRLLLDLDDSNDDSDARFFSKGVAVLRELAKPAADLWAENEEPSAILKKFRDSVVYQVFAMLPSNTQFVERIIKEAALCSLTGRGEMLRSAYAIVRSWFIHLPKPDEEADDEEVSTAAAGGSSADEEKQENDGETGEDEPGPEKKKPKYKPKVGVKEKARNLIAEVHARHERRSTLQEKLGEDYESMWQQINGSFVDPERWQRTAMTEDFLLSFEAEGIAGSDKELNVRQRKEGISYTASIVNRIEFKVIVKTQHKGFEKAFETALANELTARELTIPVTSSGNPHFNNMKKKLRAWVKDNDQKAKEQQIVRRILRTYP